MEAKPRSPAAPALAAFAESLAQEAGALALEWFRKGLDIEAKADNSPVTTADRAVEAFLRKAIAARFPDHAILGEEYGAEGSATAPTWVIDPIDGTRSFITGWPIWGTLLALTEGGQAKLGVVEMPVLGERWSAVAGEGAWFTGRDGERTPAQASQCHDLARARFYTTSLLYFQGAARAAIEEIAARSATARFGGDCYSYALLASGHVDLVIEARLEPYDFLALVPIIEAAGGVITDWAGKPLGLASDGRVIAAATAGLHAQARALLAGRG
ncbi:MAG TPA: histidinol-phosphatase [Paracoccus sp.]|nr:histidinol-phosphatase [Paracoccus sp. (in: a-proteobacteria)]